MRRTTSGWRSPWRRIESASWPSASSSKCRRGCSGLGTISWTGTASSLGAAAGTRRSCGAGKSASIPFPSAFRTPLSIQLFFLSPSRTVTLRVALHGLGQRRRCDLARERAVRHRSPRARVVEEHRHAVARALRHAYVAGDDGAKDLIAEVGADLVVNLAGDAVAPSEHREEQ